nr:hypothetical protein [Tanacetum cinerariifolium]
MDSDSAHMMASSKVPMLKPENGPSLPRTQVVEGVTTLIPITYVEDKAQRRLEVKARSTLIMGIPNEHQLKFISIKDAMQLMEAIEMRFGRCKSKVVKKLVTEWNTHVVVWRNKTDLDTMSMDDLYNNLKVYEPKVKGFNTALGISTSGTQVNTANIDNLSDAVICAFLASQPCSPQLVKEDLEQIHADDLEEMDLKRPMAMLTIRAKRGYFARECRALRSQDTKHKESTRRIVLMETPASIALVSCDGLGGYDWSDQAEEGLDEFANKLVVENYDAKTSETKPKDVRKNNDASTIEEWASDDEEKEVTQPNIE